MTTPRANFLHLLLARLGYLLHYFSLASLPFFLPHYPSPGALPLLHYLSLPIPSLALPATVHSSRCLTNYVASSGTYRTPTNLHSLILMSFFALLSDILPTSNYFTSYRIFQNRCICRAFPSCFLLHLYSKQRPYPWDTGFLGVANYKVKLSH